MQIPHTNSLYFVFELFKWICWIRKSSYSPYAIGNTREGDLFKIAYSAVKFAGQYFTKKKRLGLFIDGEEIGKYRDLDKEFSLDISGECSLKVLNK